MSKQRVSPATRTETKAGTGKGRTPPPNRSAPPRRPAAGVVVKTVAPPKPPVAPAAETKPYRHMTPARTAAPYKHAANAVTTTASPKAPATGPAGDAPPRHLAPGRLDAGRAAGHEIAHQAKVLREGAFPALMAAAVGLDGQFDHAAYRIYLKWVLRDLGDPTDPVERMLVEQLCMAHFRTAQLHVAAGQARGAEAVKLCNASAARMLGEMRRTALALKAYRTVTPSDKARAPATPPRAAR